MTRCNRPSSSSPSPLARRRAQEAPLTLATSDAPRLWYAAEFVGAGVVDDTSMMPSALQMRRVARALPVVGEPSARQRADVTDQHLVKVAHRDVHPRRGGGEASRPFGPG